MILFYSDEHEPIHVHAVYGDSTMKVSFFIREGEIYRVTYAEIKGKFPPAKLKELKKFISVFKKEIAVIWGYVIRVLYLSVYKLLLKNRMNEIINVKVLS